MRVLLIAYDFPPIPSPQSLRWAYLVRELADAGHEVRVLAPDVAGYGSGGLPELPANVKVHRVWPGPYAATLTWLARRRQPQRQTGSQASPEPHGFNDLLEGNAGYADTRHPQLKLNWKGRIVERIRRLNRRVFNLHTVVPDALGRVMFPDIRAEWLPWARRRLKHLLGEMVPDVVITSHEPANSIPLGIYANKLGFRWVADLGDPVLAPYTPERWRKTAWELEEEICKRAELVLLTSQHAIHDMQKRHDVHASKLKLLTQGFDGTSHCGPHLRSNGPFDPEVLELLYTGSFYAFRDPSSLLEAVRRVPGVRLNIATIAAPHGVAEAARDSGGCIRLLGFLPHTLALSYQRQCDMLVNIANANPLQVPGKLYEYLGAHRPILHIGGDRADAARILLEETGAGNPVAAEATAIETVLRNALHKKRLAPQEPSTVVDDGRLRYSWKSLALQLADLLEAGGTTSSRAQNNLSKESV
ncbi:glycosyltransferase family 4 protein [Pseudoxanthomonas sp. z9]|uniref:glycosyltransferase family 4 protein n=1 Tax=Pseudoxanthomonas sp. z9 TaxID=2584942 RepID=UPI0011450D87|nr:glycosyltransferase family 4 protein [Pseudoxanthomonas sp. z9]